MKLRAHPLMSYRGVSNWPPVWVGTNHKNEPLRGEVGILEDVVPSQTENASRFFLRIEDEGWRYVGCLLFEDLSFCRQFTNYLQTNGCGSRLYYCADRGHRLEPHIIGIRVYWDYDQISAS